VNNEKRLKGREKYEERAKKRGNEGKWTIQRRLSCNCLPVARQNSVSVSLE